MGTVGALIREGVSFRWDTLSRFGLDRLQLGVVPTPLPSLRVQGTWYMVVVGKHFTFVLFVV